MTDPLAVGTGDRVIFPEVLVAGDTGLNLICLANRKQVAVPPFLVPGAQHRRVVPSAPRQGRHAEVARHQPAAGVTSMDRYPPLRERIIGLRGGRLLLMARILVAPLVITLYVGLTVLLLLPLLGLRRMFPRRSTSSAFRWGGNAPRYSGANLWHAATGSA